MPALRTLKLAVLVLALLVVGSPAAADTPALDPNLFPVSEKLEDNVRFWTRVFAEHSSRHVLIHDERYVHIVYSVLDFTPLEKRGLSAARKLRLRREAVGKAEQEIRSKLLRMASGHDLADAAEQSRLEAFFVEVPGDRRKYRAAVDRLRTQQGLQDVFHDAIGRSGRYMAHMERAFRDQGLPVELTRLVFVESMFQERARSKVGAGGVWQMMPATAKGHLTMRSELDERYDPLLATEGAAAVLAENFESLRSWPLAITAYNYGLNGMRRAASTYGKDLATILENHRTRTFGFASKNFYSEFVAAARVYARRDVYFPTAVPEPPLAFDELTLPQYVTVADLARGAGASLEEVEALNPAVSRQVWEGNLMLPPGYPLRVPPGMGSHFQIAYGSLPPGAVSPRQAGFNYRVRSGDTLSGIAGRYGTSVAALQNANGLASAHRIRVGQSLLVPPAGTRASALSAPGGIHVVRRGETLSAIAGRYGTSVEALAAANGLSSAHLIQVGQRLTVPGGGTGPGGGTEPGGGTGGGGVRHVVRPGETLGKIAGLYSTTVTAIQRANRIRSHLIYPQQVLIIP